MPEQLWGGETKKAVANFQISGEPVPAEIVQWLGRIKGAAARVNAELGLLDKRRAARIAKAADAVATGKHDGQFPVDVFQTGSGTSSNMNANEVIANLAGGGRPRQRPRQHGAELQRRVPVGRAPRRARGGRQAPAAGARPPRGGARGRRPSSSKDVVKSGRTHLMDAVPVTLGQEFAGYAAQVRQGHARVDAMRCPVSARSRSAAPRPAPGLNTHPQFAAKVRRLLAKETGLKISAPADPFEAQGNRDGLVEASGALKVVAVSLTKIANDLRWMGSGPRAGLAEIFLPELQKGSSIMPGKVNPVIPEVVRQVAAQVIGNDAAITIGGMSGNFELNVMIPLMGRNLLQSINLLTTSTTALADKCIDGIEANLAGCERHAESNLQVATALNPVIGYDKATVIVKEATASGRPVREIAREHGVDEAVLTKALDLRKIARGNKAR